MNRLALTAAALAAVMAAGCATQEPPPTCPQAPLRRAVCDGGLRMMSYDQTLDLAGFCEALWPANRRALSRPGVPLLELNGGVRALELKNGEWLLLARERTLGDAPEELARWWQTGRCVPPARAPS